MAERELRPASGTGGLTLDSGPTLRRISVTLTWVAQGGGSTSFTGTAARLAVTASQTAKWPLDAVMFRAPIEGAPLGFSAGIVVDTAASTFAANKLSGIAVYDALTRAGVFLGIAGSTPAVVRATLASTGASGVPTLAGSVAASQYLRISMIAADTLRLSWDPDDFANPASSTTVSIGFTPTHVALVHTEATGAGAVPAAMVVPRFIAHHPNSDRIFAYTASRDPALAGPLDLGWRPAGGPAHRGCELARHGLHGPRRPVQ